MNRLSGKSSNTLTLTYEADGKILSGLDLAERLNRFFVSVTADIPVLDRGTLPAFLPAAESLPTIRTCEVYKKLLRVSPFKACGPDAIPNRVLKEYAFELAEPATVIFNQSFSSGVFPKVWKDSHLTPIPKTTPITGDGDLRPIALTACLSKVLEDFAVEWLINDNQGHIDPNQFGSLKGLSTTFCLLDMIHNWLSSLENPGYYLRVCFLDFSKAFDHIDHNILMRKLLNMNVRRSLVTWICSFLSERRQAVKLNDNLSEWVPANAGVPQGTKPGPILLW